MTKRIYRGHVVELASEEIRYGQWAARATIIIEGEGDKTVKRIPIFGRRRATFESRRQADSYAMELCKLWIDGRLWGANGHGSHSLKGALDGNR
jgi:hypothetical protein